MADASPNAKRQKTESLLGRGGLGLDPRKTAVLLIEVQNEFMTPGGKLHEQVRPVMEEVNMLPNCIKLVEELRSLGAVQVMYAPISFSADGSDNPNRHLGILGGCDYDELFVRGSWNAQIAQPMLDAAGNIGDIVMISGKRGLSAFVNTDLDQKLKKLSIDTIALGGFMANCCVESTMRDAFDRGYNVITLTDCVATTTMRGYKSCVEITYPFFSTPMNCVSFLASVRAALKMPTSFAMKDLRDAPLQLNKPTWACRGFVHDAGSGKAAVQVVDKGAADATHNDVFQVGPYAVDVRQSAIAEKIVKRSGVQELKRYLAMGEASGAFGGSRYTEPGCNCIYSDKLKQLQSSELKETDEAFGWFCHMVVVRLPAPEGGCLVYSPVLGPESKIEPVQAVLAERGLLPVRVVVVPSPQHHLCVAEYQKVWPDALYMCGWASGQMSSLTKKRRDVRFDGRLRAPGRVADGVSTTAAQEGSIDLFPILEPSDVLTPSMPKGGGHDQMVVAWNAMFGSDEERIFDVCIVDDNRTGEIVLLHRPSKTLILSDVLYKSTRDIVGPGGVDHHYSFPEWFAKGQEELFYDSQTNVETASAKADGVKPLLPSYRTHPKARTVDVAGLRRSLDRILAWDFTRCLACHTDPIDGEVARTLIKEAWGWAWE